jgi:hypothetical protein
MVNVENVERIVDSVKLKVIVCIVQRITIYKEVNFSLMIVKKEDFNKEIYV